MEIAEIKSRLTLSRVLQHYGLKPDKQHRLHCPFHPDRTPSLRWCGAAPRTHLLKDSVLYKSKK